ncbi:MAG: TlpA family protein disulfide reductase [Anaerolineae bacterium]|nr:TlpA family protein disulfide reductase [Anaerolineae bacterium]
MRIYAEKRVVGQAGRRIPPVFWLLMAAMVLFPLSLVSSGQGKLLAQPVATAQPPFLPLPTPLATRVGDQNLQALTAEVAQANLSAGATTFWAGGRLGVDAPVDLAVTIGEKLPAFGLMARDGQPFELDLVGKPLLLNFWASWCEPCKVEFPLLVAVDGDSASPFRVVFANVWDEARSYEDFLAAYPEDIPVVIDSSGMLPGLYDLHYIPVSILVDGQGIVQLIQRGPVNREVLVLAAVLVS